MDGAVGTVVEVIARHSTWLVLCMIPVFVLLLIVFLVLLLFLLTLVVDPAAADLDPGVSGEASLLEVRLIHVEIAYC